MEHWMEDEAKNEHRDVREAISGNKAQHRMHLIRNAKWQLREPYFSNVKKKELKENAGDTFLITQSTKSAWQNWCKHFLQQNHS
jgi:hypothetical protein